MYNFYSDLKTKAKKQITEQSLVNTLGEMLVGMFDLTVDKTNINPKYFLRKLICNGVLGVVEIDNKLYFGLATFSEVNSDEGLGKNVTVVVDGMGSYYFENWKENDKVAIVRLSSFAEPDFNIFRFGYMLSEIDTSMICNIINTRLSKVFKASDEKSKNRIETALRKSYDGDLSIVVDEFLINDEIGSNYDVTELNTVDKITNIQYLSITRSYIMNTFLSLYGMYAVGGEKIAQQTVAEINQGTNASWIIPKTRLATIREDLQELNRKFNCNWSIDFSECWKNEDKHDDNTAENKTENEKNESEVMNDENNQSDDTDEQEQSDIV